MIEHVPVRSVSCPKCGAAPYGKCVSAGGKPQSWFNMHAARVRNPDRSRPGRERGAP